MRSILLPPFHSPIPHVGTSVDSTRRLPVRVHQRDLSPQSGKTLAGPLIGNEIPVCGPGGIENPVMWHSHARLDPTWKLAAGCAVGSNSKLEKPRRFRVPAGPVRQLPSPELDLLMHVLPARGSFCSQ